MPSALRSRIIPALVWVAVMGAAAVLWRDLGGVEALGFVESADYAVAPARSGRLATLDVEVGVRVRAGQIIGRLDGAALDAEVALLEAERRRITAKIDATRLGAEVRESATTRELDGSLSSAGLALKSAKSRRGIKAAELSALSRQIARLRELVGKRMATRDQLDALLVREAAVRREVAAADGMIAELVGEVATARGRREALPAESAAVAVSPLRAELEVLDRRGDLLDLEREALLLRAPVDGEVAAIFARPGELVGGGAPVLSVAGRAPARVVVCLDEGDAASVRLGEGARLTVPRAEGEGLDGHVVALGARVAQLPLRCWSDPQLPRWGREAIIAVDTDTPLLGGQVFAVRFTGTIDAEVAPAEALALAEAGSSGSQAPPTEPATPAIAAPPARAMSVPEALVQRSRLEPSGLLWSPALDRYVLVSDDTGTEEANDHAPWLFTMDRRGVVDPEPLILRGLDEVSDLEAIAPGPSDTIYILASQSRSKRGKRPKARQVFAQVRLFDRGGEVLAVTYLADVLAAAGDDAQEALGLAGLDDLDIEGMTRSGDGLLLGLKAPVGGRDEALIWRLERPASLLAGDGLAAAGLALWGSVPLRVKADGEDVPGGVAELLELADGSLLIAATASGIDPETQSGSVWRVDGRSRIATPRRLFEFPALKPEGLALNADGDGIVIVFDIGEATPKWTEVPWPAR